MKPARSNPHSLLEAAQSFRRGADTILRADGELFYETVPAFYFLTSFSFELSLKCLLMMDGLPEFPDLKDLGHNLHEALCTVAERNAWREMPHHQLLDVVLQLSDHHRDLNFRYLPKVGSFSVPHPRLTLLTLDRLLQEVEWQIRNREVVDR